MAIYPCSSRDPNERWSRYRIRLSPGDVTKHTEFLTTLLAETYQAANK